MIFKPIILKCFLNSLYTYMVQNSRQYKHVHMQKATLTPATDSFPSIRIFSFLISSRCFSVRYTYYCIFLYKLSSHIHYHAPGFFHCWIIFWNRLSLPGSWLRGSQHSLLLADTVAPRGRLCEKGLHGAGWACPIHRIWQCQCGPGCGRGHGI